MRTEHRALAPGSQLPLLAGLHCQEVTWKKGGVWQLGSGAGRALWELSYLSLPQGGSQALPGHWPELFCPDYPIPVFGFGSGFSGCKESLLDLN